MTTIIIILALPFAVASGLYHLPPVKHGHCDAKPGTYKALLCKPEIMVRLKP